MTNLEYYSFKNLNMYQYDMDNKYYVVRIDYVPKHSKEDITLYSSLVEGEENINKEKIKWLLQEFKTPEYTREDIINDDTMYIPKHARVHKQYCFEG